ncbi:MAG: trypsin-like peptidase domain-containing protein [Clostridiales bacterium]|nr:trypsin-like peptidase domain-containing protein [Clostridiales bacterium]
MYEYENNTENREDRNYTEEPDNRICGNGTEKTSLERPKKKGKVFMKRMAGVTAMAVTFGLISGGIFQAMAQNSLEALKETSNAGTARAATSMASSSSSDSILEMDNSDNLTVQEVTRIVLPSTVAINCTGTEIISTFWGNAQQQYSSCGTGIVVGESEEELLIATNCHVVNDSDTISVSFIDDAEADALIKGTDPDNDLAVIAVKLQDLTEETLEQISVAELGDSDSLEVGEQVVAIGNALGYGQSVTTGIVSALNREVVTEQSTSLLIQTDAAINPGNSGGALVNMQGQVIGINSAKYSDEEVEGMGYAIPISAASPILDELMNRETREQVSEEDSAYLGIQGQDIDERISSAYNMPEGVYLVNVMKDSPADNAGLRNGDILVEFDGTRVDSVETLQNMLKYYSAGEIVPVTVKRVEKGEYVEYELNVLLEHQN